MNTGTYKDIEKLEADLWEAAVSGTDLPKLVTEAMTAIEAEFEPLTGVVPKHCGIFETKVLKDLMRQFNNEQIKLVRWRFDLDRAWYPASCHASSDDWFTNIRWPGFMWPTPSPEPNHDAHWMSCHVWIRMTGRQLKYHHP